MATPAENTIEARAKPYIDRVENVLDQIETLKGKYMAECKGLRGDIKEIYGEAKDAKLPVKALKQIVARRELERKKLAIDESMKGEEGEYDYEMLVAALGGLADLPLGQAALDLAGDDEEEDLRPRFKQTEGEAPAAKPKRKPRSPAVEHAQALAGQVSPEEQAALDEVEAKGIGGAAAGGVIAH